MTEPRPCTCSGDPCVCHRTWFQQGMSRRKRVRLTVADRDGWVCWICGEPIEWWRRNLDDPGRLTVDHVIPKSRGGSNAMSNLRAAHRICNQQRGAPET